MNSNAIVYTSDNHYAHIMGTSLLSVLQNYKDSLDFDIHIISNGISEKNKTYLRQIAGKYQKDIYFYEIKQLLLDTVNDTSWNITTYARLFIADFLPVQVKKAVYIDGDTVAVASIGKLFGFSCSDENVVCGVIDRYNRGSARRLGLENRVYVNAGVLVINLFLWRQQNISGRVQKLLKERNWPFADQDILNYGLNGHIGILPMEYNMSMFSRKMPYRQAVSLSCDGVEKFYKKKDYEYAQKHSIIIHFSGSLFHRPWQENSRQPDREIFYKYFMQTPWKNKIRPSKRKYTDKLSTSVYFWAWEKVLLRIWEKEDYEKFSRLYLRMNQFPDNIKKIKKIWTGWR